ncbi:dihydrofolate synthase / folylpolyglutamate synthase [Chitinophaga costaii]|uniref:Dihydrofolate synthase/folylpolyglutamate synthase n=1 Tax=Chitinophaga costaii TaxID=1335309 RepID=A0A1C4CEJ3_9BACT|nr:folylpolyglutamate synthase/dihydrofolate synthase family protein [Chitinophaga costaii]PUZ27118.1 bifunctional folylpolyglutamate synthase/dihydrofolate synthase [Chitinophaga costaii]SCC17541.1 dihydrofolate synthase / folylpolyglutamate synthase [Chitinophaga costaii]
MDYSQTLDFLYNQLPVFTKQGASAIRKGLDNTLALCAALGNPEKQFKSVHIAGTNGKGSTSHMLAAIFQEAGYKTGLYTSPHLKDFRERIRVNGSMIDPLFVVDIVARLQPAIQELQPSFFEVTVAMAFSYFAEQGVDIAIVEVGLGGRLDSTNVITPSLSLITNISYDHMQLLGNTLPEIATEKAGIIKPGVPVVISETQTEVASVFYNTATSLQAPLHYADQEFLVQDSQPKGTHLQLAILHTPTDHARTIDLDLGGQYQEKNVLGVLMAVKLLQQQGWHLPEEGIYQALSHVKQLTGLHGRWEVIQQHPLTVLDVGHNEAGITEIVQQLSRQVYNQLHIVIGFVKDKDIEKVLSLLPKTAHYYFCQAQIERALEADVLTRMALHHGLLGHTFANVQLAYHAAQQAAHAEDMILVCGSFFIVGEI